MEVTRSLGIFPESIENAWKICQDTIEEQGLDRCAKSFEKAVDAGVEELIGNDLTNRIIEVMFDACKEIIEDKHPGQEVTYYINGYDSHLYPGIDPDSTEGRLEAAGLTFEEKNEILSDEGFVQDLTELFGSGGDVVIYESEAECDADNCDCLEDEGKGCCRSMADDYLNNYGGPDDVCIVLNSGRVLMAAQ